MSVLTNHAPQRTLDFPGPFRPQLDNFIVGHNGALLRLLQVQGQQPQGWHYLHGQAACGKTHLLWAVQSAALHSGLQALYLRSGDRQQLAVLQQLQGLDLLLLDDAGALPGDKSWQQSLFDALQRVQMQHTAVIMAGRVPPAAMSDLLPDLRSRLATMSQYRVQALPDADWPQLARSYLARQAIPITDEVLAYLLSRVVREQAQLLALLQRLSERVLVTGQRPTRPMLRELLVSGQSA